MKSNVGIQQCQGTLAIVVVEKIPIAQTALGQDDERQKCLNEKGLY